MEHLLSKWFQNAKKNLTISDNILKTKAKEIGDVLGLNNLKYSNGWLEGFKKRNEIKLIKLH